MVLISSELSVTPNGKILIKNFLFNMYKITKDWAPKTKKNIYSRY